MADSHNILSLKWELGSSFDVGIRDDVAEFLGPYHLTPGQWSTLIEYGAQAMVRICDPLYQSDFGKRIYADNRVSEAMAAPPRTDQRSLNADRLVRAYDLLSDKDVRVKLTCEGRRPSDFQEIYIDLPAEKS